MNRIDILKKHYEPRIDKYSDTSRVLDWENQEAQFKRFRAFTDNIELDGKSILDVGCGCGDLYRLLFRLNIKTDYTGVDILEKMTARATIENPDGCFFYADIFSSGFNPVERLGRSVFDITYTSGIFNLNVGNNEEFLKEAVPVLSELADEAFVFNLLDPASPDRDDNYFYYEPEKAVKLAEDCSERVEIITGYLSNDYTLICYK